MNTRRAARSLTRLYEEHLAPTGLTSAQFALLSLLTQRPYLAQTELAGAVDLDQTTLSRNLQLLIRNKWLKQTRASSDRRQVTYALTSTGLEIQRNALPHWQRAQRQMQRRLGPDWQTAFALLQRLTTSASA